MKHNIGSELHKPVNVSRTNITVQDVMGCVSRQVVEVLGVFPLKGCQFVFWESVGGGGVFLETPSQKTPSRTTHSSVNTPNKRDKRTLLCRFWDSTKRDTGGHEILDSIRCLFVFQLQ